MSPEPSTRGQRIRGLRGATVRAGPFLGLERLLRDLGCEPEPVLAQAGLASSELADPDHLLDYHQAGVLLAAAAAASNCPHFGLLLGQQVTALQLGISGFMVRVASTVGHALQTLVENLDLHDTGSRIRYEVGPELARIEYRVETPDPAAREQGYDLTAATICNLLRSFCGPDWNPAEVRLTRSRPAEESPYRECFRSRILFGCEALVVLFPNGFLGHALATADASLYRRLEEEATLRHKLDGKQIARFLPQLLRQGLLVDRYSAAALARSVGMNERTLHRRLQSAGTTYRRELDRVRQAVSSELLAATRLRVSDIAQSVGYADSPSFIRAFRRWSGVSPAVWRRRSARSPNP